MTNTMTITMTTTTSMNLVKYPITASVNCVWHRCTIFGKPVLIGQNRHPPSESSHGGVERKYGGKKISKDMVLPFAF